jgi:hypothetical protein
MAQGTALRKVGAGGTTLFPDVSIRLPVLTRRNVPTLLLLQ